MKVLKFGGTSVGTIESLRNVKRIVESLEGEKIVIVSALGGLTDRLIATAKKASEGDAGFEQDVKEMAIRHHDIINALVAEEAKDYVRKTTDEFISQLEDVYRGLSLIRDLPERSMNQIVSFGERMSSVIVAAIIKDAKHFDSLDYIKTEKWFNRNIADRGLTEQLIRDTFSELQGATGVAGGFISRDRDSGEITNLGRGGSDYTAALIAAALDAEELQIWTDVNGFMTADPRIIPEARVIPRMSFIESMELCSFGAKVIYPPTIYPVFHKNIPIKILNTHNPSAPGTLIKESKKEPEGGICGVSSVRNTAMITVEGDLTVNVAAINSRTYNAMARNGISVYLVAQPGSDVSFSVAMTSAESARALKVLEEEFAPELQNGEVRSIQSTADLAIIAVVGEAIKKHHGLGDRLVHTLQRHGIDVKAISDGASETTIALVVDNSNVERGLQLVHGACFS